MQQGSLMLETFADDRMELSPTEVMAVEVYGERVWVHMKDPLSFTMIEAKNAKDVVAWGRDSDKLKGENE